MSCSLFVFSGALPPSNSNPTKRPLSEELDKEHNTVFAFTYGRATPAAPLKPLKSAPVQLFGLSSSKLNGLTWFKCVAQPNDKIGVGGAGGKTGDDTCI